MNIFAHRGLTDGNSGNSVAAVRDAVSRGYSVEIDLRLTADNVFVLCHDELITTVDETIVVSETTLGELHDRTDSAVSESANDLYPTLKRVLKLFATECASDAELALHLKDAPDNPEQMRDMARLLSDSITQSNDEISGVDLFEHIFVFDITIEQAEFFIDITPDVRIGFSVGEPDFFPTERFPTIYTYEDVREFGHFDVIWADEWLGSLYSKKFFDKCRTDRSKVICVSPELHSSTDPMHPECDMYEDYWRSLIDLRVDGICTDYPIKLSKEDL